MMSLKTIPGFGKSGTSRIFFARSTVMSCHAPPEGTPEQELVELLGQLRQTVEILERPLTGLWIPGVELRDERLQQIRLVPRCRGELAQMADVGAGGDEARADGGRVGVGLGQRRLQKAVIGELACLLGRDACACTELVDGGLGLLPRRPGAAEATVLRDRRGELLAKDTYRQEVVALEAEDRLETVDVVLAEQAVPPARPLRRQQALVLEIADLRDRDVREIALET